MTVDEIQKLTVETIDAEGRVGVSALLAGLSMIKEGSAASYEEIRSKLLANRYMVNEEDQKWYVLATVSRCRTPCGCVDRNPTAEERPGRLSHPTRVRG